MGKPDTAYFLYRLPKNQESNGRKFLSLSDLSCRGLATGIYTTNSPEACQYVAANCEANVLVVENQTQLEKILKVGSLGVSAEISECQRI